MAGTLGAVASAIGIGSGVKNLTQGGSGGSSKTYVPTGQNMADQGWQQAFQQYLSQAGAGNQALNPQLMSALSSYLGIDTSGLTRGANQAGQLYAGQIPQAQAAQGNLMQNALNIQGAGNQLYQTAFDPQQALFDRYKQQVQDTSNAGGAMRGIGMSPEAAGLTNQATDQFLQNWQNQQVGREATGIQGLAGAYNQAGQNYAGALNAGALAPYYAQQSGAVPYQGQVQAASQPFNAAQAYWAAQNPGPASLGNAAQLAIPYLYAGQGATNQAYGQQQNNLGNIVGGLGYFGSPQGQSALANLGNIFGGNQQSQNNSGFTDPTGGNSSLFFTP